MSDIKVVNTAERKAIVIRDRVGMLKMAKVMGPSYQKIQEVSQFEGIDIDSIPFTSYVVKDWKKTTSMGVFGSIASLLFEKWEIEMGFLINGEADLNHLDNIDVVHVPGGTCIEIEHVGPYKNVGTTYKKLYKYAQENSYTLGGKSYEFYLNDPRETDEFQLRTKIVVPTI